MSSSAAPSLQDWIRITQANQAELAERIGQVHALQSELEALVQRAGTDPKARAALQQLETLAIGDWALMRQRLEENIGQLRQCVHPTSDTAQQKPCAAAAIRRTFL